MREETRTDAIDKVIFKTALYYNHEVVPPVLDMWHSSLAEFEIHDIYRAFSLHVKTSRFFPSIAEIIDIIGRNENKLSIEARALQQWRVVMSAVRKYGINRRPQFADPITAHLVKTQFLWTYLCGFPEQEENWEQKRWCEAFKLSQETHKDLAQLEVPGNVSGLIENVGKKIIDNEPGPAGQVPLDKITAFKERIKPRADQDDADIKAVNTSINVRLEVLKKQAQALGVEQKTKNLKGKGKEAA
jgi:hypothetical protein